MRSGYPGDPSRGYRPQSLVRIRLSYWWRHGRWPDLRRPTRFTELVQRRKLVDRDPRLPMLTDKLAVKDFVAKRLGREWVTPTLWSGTDLPESAPWGVPSVVKSRHGCNQIAFLRDGEEDWGALRRRARRWMRSSYGGWLDEWAYRDVPRGLIAEPFISDGDALPVDYKFYCFGGRVEVVQVHLEREHAHRWMQFDRNWRRLSAAQGPTDPAPPAALRTMIEAAEVLSQGFDFIRVDLYDLPLGPRFGEFAFYPGSGYDPFDTAGLDAWLGGLWIDAERKAERRRRAA